MLLIDSDDEAILNKLLDQRCLYDMAVVEEEGVYLRVKLPTAEEMVLVDDLSAESVNFIQEDTE